MSRLWIRRWGKRGCVMFRVSPPGPAQDHCPGRARKDQQRAASSTGSFAGALAGEGSSNKSESASGNSS